MGLRGWLAGRAVRAARVLVVECPGAWAGRVGAERAIAARGWRAAESPASADVLLVVGEPEGEMAEVVQRLWDAMPGPRARVQVVAPADLAPVLDDVADRLVDDSVHRSDAVARTAPDPAFEGDHGSMDHTDMQGMDHADMQGMDHGDMEMAPDGIPLAEGSEDDRDGLEMDVLPVRLGPVLPGWPAGLVLDLSLHGDVIGGASARRLGNGGPPPGADLVTGARACDDVAVVLGLAGWAGGAARARAARDAHLDGRGERADDLLADLSRRVSASRMLRWSMRGVGVVTAARAGDLGLPDHVTGDCLDRLHVLLDRAASGPSTTAPVPVSAIAPLVVGSDLAVARLIVASLGTSLATAEVPAGA